MIVVAPAVLLVTWNWARSRGEVRLHATLARLDAEEPGWRLADQIAAYNAALAPATDDTAGVWVRRASAARTSSFATWNRDATDAPVTSSFPDDEAFEAAKRVHAENRRAIDFARATLTKAARQSNVDEGDALSLQFPSSTHDDDRIAVELLKLDARVQAAYGETPTAFVDCRAMLHLAASIGYEPSVSAQLDRAAFTLAAVKGVEQVLAWHGAPDGLVELQTLLAAERDVPRLTVAYRAERGRISRLYEFAEAGKMTPRDGFAGPLYQWYDSRNYALAQALVLDDYSELVAASKLPDPKRAAAVAAIEARVLAEVRSGDRPFFIPFPTPAPYSESESRLRARLGCAVAGIACERYRMKNGRWPHTLAEIPRDILAAIPTDPYTGGPISYHVRDDGVTLFSVGGDAPDGGELYGKLGVPDAAQSFRLWNP